MLTDDIRDDIQNSISKKVCIFNEIGKILYYKLLKLNKTITTRLLLIAIN
jgi:hypothetical protein